jgi:ABC-type multidrug transport system fused ATPase/permease subunit
MEDLKLFTLHCTLVKNAYLFNDTIKNNIKFDMPKATLDEVMEAAKKLAAMISLCLCLMNIRP